MSTAPSQTKLRVRHLLKYLRVYEPDSPESTDEWSTKQTGLASIGDVFTLFKPIPGLSGSDSFEIEVAGLALIFGEDADFPMAFYIDDQSYQMSFMEGILSSKAEEAKEKGLGLYCLRSTLMDTLDSGKRTKLGLMRKLGASGERKNPPAGFLEPLCYFLNALKIEYDPALERDPLGVTEFASLLWSTDNSSLNGKELKIDASFIPVEEEQGGLLIDLPAESPVDSALIQEESSAASADQSSSSADLSSSAASTAPAVDGEPSKLKASRASDSNEVWDMLQSPTKPKPSDAFGESSELKNLFQKTNDSFDKKITSDPFSSAADALFGPSDKKEILGSDDLFAAKPVEEIFSDRVEESLHVDSFSGPEGERLGSTGLFDDQAEALLGDKETESARADEDSKAAVKEIESAKSDEDLKAAAKEIESAKSDEDLKAAAKEIESARADEDSKAAAKEIESAKSDEDPKAAVKEIESARADEDSKAAVKEAASAGADEDPKSAIKEVEARDSAGADQSSNMVDADDLFEKVIQESSRSVSSSELSTQESSSSEASNTSNAPVKESEGKDDAPASSKKELPSREKIQELLAKKKAAALNKDVAKNSSATVSDQDELQESASIEVKPQESAESSDAVSQKPKGSEDSADSPADDAETQGVDEGVSGPRPQKKLSLQATLAKLDEQTQKANQRLDEFKKSHELSCKEELEQLESAGVKFEADFKDLLNSKRKEIVVKMRLASLQSTERLALITDEGKEKVEARIPAFISVLEDVCKEVDLSSIDMELELASDKVWSLSSERLGILKLLEDGKNPLDAILDEELSKIREWHGVRLQSYVETFERLSTGMQGRTEELAQRLKHYSAESEKHLLNLLESDLRQLDVIDEGLAESRVQFRKIIELRLKKETDLLLAEKVYPAVAAIKSALSNKSNSLRTDLIENLLKESSELHASFESTLAGCKEPVDKIKDALSSLHSDLSEREKENAESRIEKLTKFLDELLDELKAAAEAPEAKEPSENSIEKKSGEIGKNCLREIDESFAQFNTGLVERNKNVLDGLNERGDSANSELLSRMQKEIETRRSARLVSRKKLEERLDQLTESIEALSSQLIQ